jgi:glycogen debranching enzyme
VLTSAGEADTLVRARGTRFVVTTRLGDIAPAGARELGFFVDDTRYLSHYALSLTGASLVHLSSDPFGAAYNRIDLMVSGLSKEEFLDDPQNFLHVRRQQLVDGDFVDETQFVNYLQRSVDLGITFDFASDFADVFEVRGAKRERRGILQPAHIRESSVELAYQRCDGGMYVSTIAFSPRPTALSGDRATFRMSLGAGQSGSIEIHVLPHTSQRARPATRVFDERSREVRGHAERFREESTHIACDNTVIQRVLEQSAADLHSLSIDVSGRNVLAAGIPWFCCPFGRDALLSSYEALTLNPSLATSSLKVLASLQGEVFDDFTEEEPGKIFHELRFGEMAVCREMPHVPYYGSVDATPLFVVVADATFLVTADRSLLEELAPAIKRALAWIDERSACATRPVTYRRRSPRGLDNQGWKDSRAGVSFPDGERAVPPIALCEVQGYCVDAYRRGSRLLAALGDPEGARVYADRALAMTELVQSLFWLPSETRYAFAIDGRDRVVPTIVSNLGHLLWSRASESVRARATADLLTRPESLSAFGVRTLAATQPVYNPLSYHNGTVWPHDNALIAKGFANYNLMDHASIVFETMVAAMGHFRDRRLPELYCGMSTSTENLVRYPVACSPQAWAAAAPFLLLQAVLGIHVDGPASCMTIRNPRMPESLTRVEFEGLRVGGSRVALRFRRVGHRCHVDRLDVTGAPLRTYLEFD